MNKRRVIQSLVGSGLGLALCWGLINQTSLDWQHLTELLEQLDGMALMGVVLISWLMIEAAARKWACLDHLRDGVVPQSHRFYLRHTIWQSWLAQLLPAPVAVIAGRALVTHQTDGQNWRRGLKNGLHDQLSELLVIVAFIPGTLWQLSAQIGWLPWLVCGCVVTALATWLGHRFWPRLIMPLVIGWSFTRIALMTLRLILGIAVFALPISYAAAAFATPLATLTALLPLTPGNIGVAEWGWAYALTLWHVAPATGALYAFSFRITVLAVQAVLLTALLFLPKRMDKR